MIKDHFAQTFTALINKAIQLDGDYQTLLTPLQGQPLTLTLTDLGYTFTLQPSADGFSLFFGEDYRAETVIEGKLRDLLKLLMSDDPQSHMTGSGVKVSGQLGTFSAYQTFFKQLDLDWEVKLADHIGANAAHAIARPLKGAARTAQRHFKLLPQDLSEWLQEEARLLPPRLEVEDFFEGIAELQERVDRLDAKVKYYKGH